MTFVKKSTPATEQVVGAAAASIKDSVAKLVSGLEEVKKLPELLASLELQIAAKEDKLKELDVEYANKQKQHSVEFGLKVKEDSGKVVSEILASQHLVAIPKAELDQLHKNLDEYESTFDKKVSEKVHAASGAIAKDFQHKEALLAITHKADTAEKDGKIASLSNEVTVLNAQLLIAQKNISDERNAGTERAKSNAIGNITIGGSEGNKR